MKNKNPNLYYKNRNRHFYTFCCLTNDNVHNSHTMFLFIRLRNEIKPRLVHADSPEQHAKALSTSSKAKSPKGGHQRQRRFPQNVMVSTPKIIRAKIRGSLLVFMFKSCIHCLNPNGFFYLQKPLAPQNCHPGKAPNCAFLLLSIEFVFHCVLSKEQESSATGYPQNHEDCSNSCAISMNIVCSSSMLQLLSCVRSRRRISSQPTIQIFRNPSIPSKTKLGKKGGKILTRLKQEAESAQTSILVNRFRFSCSPTAD